MKELIWIPLCEECGELGRAPNGSVMEARARIHKEENPNHKVYIAAEVN